MTLPFRQTCVPMASSSLKISHIQIKENVSEVSNEFQFVEVRSPVVLAEMSSEFDSHYDSCSIELCRASGYTYNNSLSPVHLRLIVTEFIRYSENYQSQETLITYHFIKATSVLK